MFEKQYKKYCQEMTPSPALEKETVALMQEAQNHRTAPPPQPLRWRPAVVLPIAGTAAAAAIALVITGGWLLRGDGDTFNDTFTEDFDSVFESIEDEEQAPGTDDGEISDEMQPDDSADKEIPEEDGLKSDSDEDQSNQNDLKDEDEKSNPSEKPEQDQLKEEPSEGTSSVPDDEDEKKEENQSSTPPSSDSDDADKSDDAEIPTTPIDPYGPEVSHEKGIDTYLSIREFIDALAKKETTGYGKNYYNARELLIVPNLLPDGARFRHLHLNTKNGKYNYSYYFAKDGQDYIIDIEINAKTPKNLNELRLMKQDIAKEEILSAKKDDQLFFLFGKQDEVTVTLTDVHAANRLTEEETATLLSQFKLERCTLTNNIIEMKY